MIPDTLKNTNTHIEATHTNDKLTQIITIKNTRPTDM